MIGGSRAGFKGNRELLLGDSVWSPGGARTTPLVGCPGFFHRRFDSYNLLFSRTEPFQVRRAGLQTPDVLYTLSPLTARHESSKI